MGEMIERVARALAERAIRAARKWDTPAEKLEEMIPSAVDYHWPSLVDDARVAIQAMKITDAVEGVPGGIAFEDAFFGSDETVFHAMAAGWNATIDAALSSSTSGHASDCAVHNEPAYPNGPCDCGAASKEEGNG